MAKIVIIGDKEVDLKFLKIILVNQGHEVYTDYCFEKAEEAFAKYADETAAIIVEPLLQGSAGMNLCPILP